MKILALKSFHHPNKKQGECGEMLFVFFVALSTSVMTVDSVVFSLILDFRRSGLKISLAQCPG
jgi:hypothetical protein